MLEVKEQQEERSTRNEDANEGGAGEVVLEVKRVAGGKGVLGRNTLMKEEKERRRKWCWR